MIKKKRKNKKSVKNIENISVEATNLSKRRISLMSKSKQQSILCHIIQNYLNWLLNKHFPGFDENFGIHFHFELISINFYEISV